MLMLLPGPSCQGLISLVMGGIQVQLTRLLLQTCKRSTLTGHLHLQLNVPLAYLYLTAEALHRAVQLPARVTRYICIEVFTGLEVSCTSVVVQ